ncbi:transposase InsO family protein [Pedobacter sp. CG_S7]|uniref:IS3 family transposase n=1 Tax=Pedobacter sp. CG_S7 TaxID=3143930 RepID=UPI003399B058
MRCAVCLCRVQGTVDVINRYPEQESKRKLLGNTVAESFFKTMKTDMVYHEVFKTRKQASLAIFEYIEVWYNRKRSHSTLLFLTPLEFENTLTNNEKAA